MLIQVTRLVLTHNMRSDLLSLRPTHIVFTLQAIKNNYMRLLNISIILILVTTSLYSQVIIEDIEYKNLEFDDLSFLKNEIKNNNIICLGEEWHRTETFSQLKNRIIKYLHKELGFNSILFESLAY